MITLQEALKEICHYTIWIDIEGKIHAIGEQPPKEVTERLERAGFGSGGDEWKVFVKEMLHPKDEAKSVEDMLLARMRGD